MHLVTGVGCMSDSWRADGREQEREAGEGGREGGVRSVTAMPYSLRAFYILFSPEHLT